MANPITHLIAKITGNERRKKERLKKLVRISFQHYKSSARMLAIALSKGMKYVPGFLENQDYISYLTLIFRDDNFNISLLLSDLERLGYYEESLKLKTVKDNYTLTILRDEKQIEQYIHLLWDLFHTPNPQ